MNVHVERSTTIDRARSSVGSGEARRQRGCRAQVHLACATKTTYVPSASQSVRTRSSPGLSAPIRGRRLGRECQMRHAVASYREMRSKGDRSLRSPGLIRPEVEARLDESYLARAWTTQSTKRCRRLGQPGIAQAAGERRADDRASGPSSFANVALGPAPDDPSRVTCERRGHAVVAKRLETWRIGARPRGPPGSARTWRSRGTGRELGARAHGSSRAIVQEAAAACHRDLPAGQDAATSPRRHATRGRVRLHRPRRRGQASSRGRARRRACASCSESASRTGSRAGACGTNPRERLGVARQGLPSWRVISSPAREAFEMLRAHSRRTSRKLVDVAAAVVDVRTHSSRRRMA